MRFFLTLALVALSLSITTGASAQALPKMTICTGNPDLIYNQVAGPTIAANVSDAIDVSLKTSDGGFDNIEHVLKGECDAGFAQKDNLLGYRKISPQVTNQLIRVMDLYPEAVHFLCNTTKFKDRVTGLMNNSKVSLAVGPLKSGPSGSWMAFQEIEPRYESVPPVKMSGQEALNAVIQGEVGCMLVVAGANSQLIKDANTEAARGAPIRLMNFDDKDFYNSKKAQIDGSPVYTYYELPKDGNYTNLTGWSKPDTVATQAVFFVSRKWYDQNKGIVYNNLVRGVRMAVPQITSQLKR